MRRSAASLLLLVSAIGLTAQAQIQNTFYARAFPGPDVGSMVKNALQGCNLNNNIPCFIIIDPSLNTFAAGTLPSLPSNVYLADYRNGWPWVLNSGGAGALSNLTNFASLSNAGSADSVTNRFCNWQAATQTTRSILWIDPLSPPDNSSLSFPTPGCQLGSTERYLDARGTSVPVWTGIPSNGNGSGLSNAIVWGAWETQQANATLYQGFLNQEFYYNPIQGGVYNFYSGGGTKTDYINVGAFSHYQTIGQKWGMQSRSYSNSDGENWGFSNEDVESGGTHGVGEEPSGGLRVEKVQASTSAAVPTGGVFDGTVTGISGSAGAFTVTYTASNDETTVGEHCCFRDLGSSSYSKGNISTTVNVSNFPVTGWSAIEVTGDGTGGQDWTTLGAFGSGHWRSTYQNNSVLGEQVLIGANLCFSFKGAGDGSYDLTFPIAYILDSTHVYLMDVLVGVNGGDFTGVPTSGSYSINGCAYPSGTDVVNHKFTTVDASGLTNGDTIDQSLGATLEFDGAEILLKRHLGRQYGAGVDVVNEGAAGSPGYSASFGCSGLFQACLYVGYHGENSGVPQYGVFSNKQLTSGFYYDVSENSVTNLPFLKFLDTLGNLVDCIDYTTVNGSAGMRFNCPVSYGSGAGGGVSASIALQTAAGSGASVISCYSGSCNTAAGTFKITSGTGTTTGNVAIISFTGGSLPSNPTCEIDTRTQGSGYVRIDSYEIDNSGSLYIWVNTAMTASTIYQISYLCGSN